MILDIGKYQAESPYPSIGAVKKDVHFAATLLDAYSGEVSELTTVLQYAHHSLRCKAKHNEISEVFRGIFYVETLHVEFLGECILKLGGDVDYLLKLKENMIYWQSSFVAYEAQPMQMLMANIEGEKYATSFYEESSKSASQPGIANLLSRLAEDERLHIQILSDLHRRFSRSHY